MGKGDRRSRRGKIRLGSYGNTRRRKKARSKKTVSAKKGGKKKAKQ